MMLLGMRANNASLVAALIIGPLVISGCVADPTPAEQLPDAWIGTVLDFGNLTVNVTGSATLVQADGFPIPVWTVAIDTSLDHGGQAVHQQRSFTLWIDQESRLAHGYIEPTSAGCSNADSEAAAQSCRAVERYVAFAEPRPWLFGVGSIIVPGKSFSEVGSAGLTDSWDVMRAGNTVTLQPINGTAASNFWGPFAKVDHIVFYGGAWAPTTVRFNRGTEIGLHAGRVGGPAPIGESLEICQRAVDLPAGPSEALRPIASGDRHYFEFPFEEAWGVLVAEYPRFEGWVVARTAQALDADVTLEGWNSVTGRDPPQNVSTRGTWGFVLENAGVAEYVFVHVAREWPDYFGRQLTTYRVTEPEATEALGFGDVLAPHRKLAEVVNVAESRLGGQAETIFVDLVMDEQGKPQSVYRVDTTTHPHTGPRFIEMLRIDGRTGLVLEELASPPLRSCPDL